LLLIIDDYSLPYTDDDIERSVSHCHIGFDHVHESLKPCLVLYFTRGGLKFELFVFNVFFFYRFDILMLKIILK
jgi:hypothetical protein